MESSSLRKFQVWDRWGQVMSAMDWVNSQQCEPDLPVADAADLARSEALRPIRVRRRAEPILPFTLDWFTLIEDHRYTRPGAGLPKLLEFTKHSGETVLGFGDTLGTDLVQYARHGANVTVCNPNINTLAVARRNFEVRQLDGKFIPAANGQLPIQAHSVDVVCLDMLKPEMPDAMVAADEVYRVLKPGGKVVGLWPARYNAAYWQRILVPWDHFFRTPSNDLSISMDACTSARLLKKAFAHFREHRVQKRHLRRSELPHIWRWQPLMVLERLLGKLLVMKAFKPLSAVKEGKLAA